MRKIKVVVADVGEDYGGKERGTIEAGLKALAHFAGAGRLLDLVEQVNFGALLGSECKWGKAGE